MNSTIAIQQQKEELIRKAIQSKGIEPFDLDYIKENFSFREHPCGSSDYLFQDEVLIHFEPMEIKEIERNDDIVIQMNQKYKCYFPQGQDNK